MCPSPSTRSLLSIRSPARSAKYEDIEERPVFAQHLQAAERGESSRMLASAYGVAHETNRRILHVSAS